MKKKSWQLGHGNWINTDPKNYCEKWKENYSIPCMFLFSDSPVWLRCDSEGLIVVVVFFVFQFLLLNIEEEWTNLRAKSRKTSAILGYFRRSIGNFSNATKSNFCVISIHCHQRSDFNNLFGVLFDDRIEHQRLFYLKLAVEIPNAVFIFSFQAEMNFCKNFVNTCCGFCHLKESHWV